MQEGAKEGHCEAGHFLWHTRAWQWQNVPQQPFGMASAGFMAQASDLATFSLFFGEQQDGEACFGYVSRHIFIESLMHCFFS